jgi:hypothetical protein
MNEKIKIFNHKITACFTEIYYTVDLNYFTVKFCFDRKIFNNGKETIKRNRVEWDLNLNVSATLVLLGYGEAAKSTRYGRKCSGFSHEIFILLRNERAQYGQ